MALGGLATGVVGWGRARTGIHGHGPSQPRWYLRLSSSRSPVACLTMISGWTWSPRCRCRQLLEILAGNVVALIYAGGHYLQNICGWQRPPVNDGAARRVALRARRYGISVLVVPGDRIPDPPRRGGSRRQRRCVAHRRSRRNCIDQRDPRACKGARRRDPRQIDQCRRCV